MVSIRLFLEFLCRYSLPLGPPKLAHAALVTATIASAIKLFLAGEANKDTPINIRTLMNMQDCKFLNKEKKRILDDGGRD